MPDFMNIIFKLISILIMSFIGLIVGAIILHFVITCFYIALFGSGPVTNSYECARGMAFGWLSLVAGAVLGLCMGA